MDLLLFVGITQNLQSRRKIIMGKVVKKNTDGLVVIVQKLQMIRDVFP